MLVFCQNNFKWTLTNEHIGQQDPMLHSIGSCQLDSSPKKGFTLKLFAEKKKMFTDLHELIVPIWKHDINYS